MSRPVDPSPALAPIVDLAKAAGRELVERFRPACALQAERKGFRDLVTDADRASERRIIDGLRRQYPEDAILSEESGRTDPPSPTLRSTERLWIVDPLDGTTNFAHGHPLFSISIALWVDDRPSLAVVHAPQLRETYWAERGGGAFRDGVPLEVSAVEELSEALLATGFSYSRDELNDGALVVFTDLLRRAREIRRGGSACLDLAYTAAGIFAGFWEHYLAPHDVAAGALLVEEAGGRVTDCVGGSDFLHGRSLVAGAASIHTALLRTLEAGPGHPGPPPVEDSPGR